MGGLRYRFVYLSLRITALFMYGRVASIVQRATRTPNVETGMYRIHRMIRTRWNRISTGVKLLITLDLMAIAAVGFVLFITSVVVALSLDSATDRDLEHHANAARALLAREASYLQKEAHMIANLEGLDKILASGDEAALRELLSPVLVTQGLDGIGVFSADGRVLLTLGELSDPAPEDTIPYLVNEPLSPAMYARLTMDSHAIGLMEVAEHLDAEGRLEGVFATYRGIDEGFLAEMKTSLGPDFMLDQDGVIISSLPDSLLDHLIPINLLQRPVPWDDFRFLTLKTPAGRERLLIGTLDVAGMRPSQIGVLQRAELSTALVPQTISHILVFGFLLVLVTLLLIHFLVLRVFRPLRTLKQSAEMMAGGELGMPVQVSGVVEIDDLAVAFERMRNQLQNAFQGQQRWNNRLEKEVQERTHELESICRQRDGLLAKLVFAQEEEQRRIARELHDDTSQALANLAVTLGVTAQGITDEDVKDRLVQLKSYSLEALENIKRIIADLRPRLLDEYGLMAAIRWYVQDRLSQTGIEVTIEELGTPVALQPYLETGLFRVVQEAVNNVARHADPSSVQIEVCWRDTFVTVEVYDNGRGFDSNAILAQNTNSDHDRRRGLGLIGMRERVELVGGNLTVTSKPGSGTCITVHVPVPKARNEQWRAYAYS